MKVGILFLHSGQAVTVGVTMYVLSISELSEVQMVSLPPLILDVQ